MNFVYSSTPDFSESETTSFIPVTGRRWRGAQLDIPERLQAQLISELIAGKFAMKQFLPGAAGHEHALCRVLDAQRALGERNNRFDEARFGGEAAVHALSTVRALLRSRPPGDVVTAAEVVSVIAPAGWARCDEVVDATVRQLLDGGELVELAADAAGALAERRFGRGPAFS
ncbi:MAG: hypothetical protein GX868_10160 [Actinobacteria bacterium]|nr:hypothetical protein [Actinomycetota bacterium]